MPPFFNRSQVVPLPQLPGCSFYQLIAALRGKSDTKEMVREALRHEFEKRPYAAILMVHAVAGGTGSALGACLLAET